jgi:hypothetical protein
MEDTMLEELLWKALWTTVCEEEEISQDFMHNDVNINSLLVFKLFVIALWKFTIIINKMSFLHISKVQ